MIANTPCANVTYVTPYRGGVTFVTPSRAHSASLCDKCDARDGCDGGLNP